MGSSDRVPDAGGQHSGGAADRDLTSVGPTFETWQHDSLVNFAYESNARIKELEADLKAAMSAYRGLLRRLQ